MKNYSVDEIKSLTIKRFNERKRFDFIDISFWLSLIVSTYIIFDVFINGYSIFDLISIAFLFGVSIYCIIDGATTDTGGDECLKNEAIEKILEGRICRFVCNVYVYTLGIKLILDYIGIDVVSYILNFIKGM